MSIIMRGLADKRTYGDLNILVNINLFTSVICKAGPNIITDRWIEYLIQYYIFIIFLRLLNLLYTI